MPEGNIVRQPLWQRIILLTVLGYEGAGGVVGGALLVIAPDGRLMQMPVHIMHGTFRDFLIPGMILLAMGILTLSAFISVLRSSRHDWFMAGLALVGFYIWFVTEIIILKELHWLHAMWGLPVLLGLMAAFPLAALRHRPQISKKVLLCCGLLSSIWYVAINLYVPTQYEYYSHATFTVSELSALGAPTRLLWVLVVIPYLLLFSAFGWGVLQAGRENCKLRITGYLILAYSVFNLYWPPMHMRGAQATLSDTLHIAWAGITVPMMMAIMVVAGLALGQKFRVFSFISLAALVLFGMLTATEAPQIATNGPTPRIGIWERINIGVFLLWIAIFATILLRRETPGYNASPDEAIGR